MADLIAQGPQAYNRWRREVPHYLDATAITIGRQDADWNVPWDSMISRNHVRLIPGNENRLLVEVADAARNPVYHHGQAQQSFTLVPGDHFVIGKTTFTLASTPAVGIQAPIASAANQDVTENIFDHIALRRRHFRDINQRIEVLTRLPDLIASSDSNQELLVRVTSVLLQSTPSAECVSILSAPNLRSDPGAIIEELHYDNRSASMGAAPVSRRLVARAIEQRESILHVWAAGDHAGSADAAPQFTSREDVDWAFCVPLRTRACRGWAIYITGRTPETANDSGGNPVSVSDQLHDDVKFAELVGTTIASLRQTRQLSRRQAAMRHFFAPVVMRALASGDSDQVLQPREAELTVMFRDLRGFSRHSEQNSQQLLQLLSDVSDALGVMTKHILGFDGVIGDFHGDAAMGFWGWPLSQTHSLESAARAALMIRNEYQQSQMNFRCGIGIAHGRAVAGQIGTKDQVKVTAFGPVVNLASRLESMTKHFGAEIIIDQAAYESLCNRPEMRSQFTTRRLAQVLPAGFQSSTTVYQLVDAVDNESATCQLTAPLITRYELGLRAFEQGDQATANEQLQGMPEWDVASRLLLDYMAEHGADEGVLRLAK